MNLRKYIREVIEEGLSKELFCPVINVTQEIVDFVNKFETDEQLLRSGGLPTDILDMAAFGFTEHRIKTLQPKQLKIKWKIDWENVKHEQERSGLSKLDYAKKISLEEPIDVSFEKGKFFVEDGHHRLFAALVRKEPLKVNLVIEDNPIKKLAPTLGYDVFHRCLFKQVKESNVDGLNEGKIKLNRYLYHASAIANRKRIEKNGIVPYRGFQWLSDTDIEGDAVFATNSDNKVDWFDSTWDDDVWRIDTKKLNGVKWFLDPNTDNGVWIYTHQAIPRDAIELIKKGTGKDML